MKKPFSLWKIFTIVFIGIILFSNTILYGLITYQHSQYMQEREKELLLSVGQQFALETTVKEALLMNQTNELLQARAKRISELSNLDYVVVINMKGIRLTHPDPHLIGQHFKGNDEQPALQGKTFTSTSVGTLGTSIRGFVPVYNDEQEQIGVVAVGITLHSFTNLLQDSQKYYLHFLCLSVIIGGSNAFLLARYLKRKLFNLEPWEMTQLLEERNAMLNGSHDAIVVTNTDNIITLANQAAQKFYHKTHPHASHSLQGRHIRNWLKNSQQIDLEHYLEQGYQQDGQNFLFYRAPILVKQEIVGYLNILKDTTHLRFVLDQLYQTTDYAKDLQLQSHAFINQLHIIFGLIDLENYEELKIYLSTLLEPQENLTQNLSLLVKNPMIAGFFSVGTKQFTEHQLPFHISIENEIPPTSQKNSSQILTSLSYLHYYLLENATDQLANVSVTLSYDSDHLSAEYHLQLTQPTSTSFQQYFESSYFTLILQETQARWQIYPNTNDFQLTIIYPYQGDE